MYSAAGKLSESFPPSPAAHDNPLLYHPSLPHGSPPLDIIRPEHFLPAMRVASAAARKKINAIARNLAPPTFENTIEALEFAGAEVTRIAGIFCSMAASCSTDDMRKAEPAIRKALAMHAGAVMTNEALFARIDALQEIRLSDPERQMLLDRTYKKFIRSGAALDEDGRAKLRGIDKELIRLQTLFENNQMKSIAHYKKIITDEAELKGVPDRIKNICRQEAQEDGKPGKWMVRIAPPPGLDIPPDILSYADNRALREEIYRATYNIATEAPHDNRPIIMDIVRLRHEKARMLGHENYAAFALDDRMAKNTKTVMDFLEKCINIYKPAAKEHLQQVSGFSGLADFQPWDFSYYNRKFQEKKFNVDLESLRPYFALNNVIEGWREHAEEFFNICLEHANGKHPVHHADVRVIEAFSNTTDKILGVLHGDYHARPGAKSAAARMDAIRERGLVGEKDVCAITSVLCSFSGPNALLSIKDVRDFFHEKGHALHSILAKGKYQSQNGTNVQWDFVELPSQLQENYAREAEILGAFAVHYQTGEKLDPDTLKRALALEKSDTAYVKALQTYLSLLDMKWHMTDPDKIGGADALEDEMTAAHWIFPKVGNVSASFGHLFGDDTYAAGFYSYAWDDSLVADIFETLKKKDLYDPETTDRLRHTIYEKGGTVAPKALFIEAMGRKPDLDALFRFEGFLPEKKRAENTCSPPDRKLRL